MELKYITLHTVVLITFWYSIARSNGLLVTGGSDFHCNLTRVKTMVFRTDVAKVGNCQTGYGYNLQFIKEEAYL